jgi:hypothetical protein
MSLIKLLETYSIDTELVKLVSDVMKDDKNHETHSKLRRYLYNKKYPFGDYYEEYEEILYFECGDTKVWYKDGKSCNQTHRTRKVPIDHPLVKEYGLDSYLNKSLNPIVGEHLPPPEAAKRLITLPASIGMSNREWRVEGNYERDDVDEWGNRLPTDEYSSGETYWNAKNTQHRAEFGKNPNDLETYNKPLPAVVRDSGKFIYKYFDKTHTIEEMADIIKYGESKTHKKVKRMVIKFANGDIQEINHEMDEVVLYTV